MYIEHFKTVQYFTIIQKLKSENFVQDIRRYSICTNSRLIFYQSKTILFTKAGLCCYKEYPVIVNEAGAWAELGKIDNRRLKNQIVRYLKTLITFAPPWLA